MSHQIGHILFIAGMLYLLYRIHIHKISGPGWFEFKCFLFLIIFWNILTFSGHWMHKLVNTARFFKEGPKVAYFTITDSFDALYYFTRLDHLLLVPSFVFLFFALQKWKRRQ